MNRDLENFKNCGHLVFEIENRPALNLLKTEVLSVFSDTDSLSHIHTKYNTDNINKFRIEAYSKLNNIADWQHVYYSLAENRMNMIVGSDLLIQNKLNLSVQMPEDKSSQLAMHTDTLSGQSEFEVVLWVPLTNTSGTNSMFLFNKSTTDEIYKEMPKFEKLGMEELFREFEDECKFLELKFGEAIIFSPTLFHGNVINSTSETRVSINCRFKSLFAPEFDGFPSERQGSSFYQFFKASQCTQFALKHDDAGVVFND